jgi:biopolymer transport protein TolQ
MEENLWTLVSKTVTESGSIEQAVFFLLLAFSIACWCIVFLKITDLQAAQKNGAQFMKLFEGADSFGAVMTGGHSAGESPQAAIFKAALTSLEQRGRAAASAVNDPRQIQLRPGTTPEDMLLLDMSNASAAEFSRLRRGMSFLATIGSTSPFIGLFGTVWGIMDTFRALGTVTSASLSVVAPGISASLIATAAGLAVAIPAVMAYNWLIAKTNALQDSCDSFTERLRVLVRASGYFESAHAAPAKAPPAATVPAAEPQAVKPEAPVAAAAAVVRNP